MGNGEEDDYMRASFAVFVDGWMDGEEGDGVPRDRL